MSFTAYVYGTKKCISIPNKEITKVNEDGFHVYMRLHGINSFLAVYLYNSLKNHDGYVSNDNRKSKCIGWISLLTLGHKRMMDFTRGNDGYIWEQMEDDIL